MKPNDSVGDIVSNDKNQLIPKSHQSLDQMNSEDMASNLFFSKKKPVIKERTLREAQSFQDLFNIPTRQVKKEMNTNLKNSFKIFMIRQNVKKFVSILQYKMRQFNRLNTRHFKVINDKAADVQVLQREGVKVVASTVLKHMESVRRKRSTLPGTLLAKQIGSTMILFLEFCLLNPLKKVWKEIEKVLDKYIPVIEPQSTFAKVTGGIKQAVLTFYIIVIPVDIGFGVDILTNSFLQINMIFQGFFFLMMLMNFTKATFKNGQLVQERSKIILYYFSGQFWIDLFSLLALFISSVLQYQQYDDNLGLILLIFYAQLGSLFEENEQYSKKGFNSSKVLRYVSKFISLLLMILFAEHIFSCIFYYASRLMQKYDYPSFIDKNQLDNQTWLSQYITTFYFASTTMVTVGYGDLGPINNGERIIVVIFQLLSSIQLSYSVSTIGNIIQEIKIETQQNQQKNRLINEYMESKNVSPQLQMQIREYLNYFWREQEAEQHMSLQQDIVNQLPEYLKTKLLQEANQQIIKDCPLFKKFSFSDSLMKNIYKILVAINLLPETLVENEKRKNNITGPCICYVEKGAISLSTGLGHTATIVDEFNEKEYFGLQEFVIGRDVSTLIYKSTQFSRLLILPLTDFLDVIKNFKEDKETFCQLKDSHQFEFQQLPPICYACKEASHVLTRCPLSHYEPNHERIIKSHVFPRLQGRGKLSLNARSRVHSCFSALIDYHMVNDTAIQFSEDNSKLMEGLYEQHVDNYSSSSEDENDQLDKFNTNILTEIKEVSEEELDASIDQQQKSQESRSKRRRQIRKDPLPKFFKTSTTSMNSTLKSSISQSSPKRGGPLQQKRQSVMGEQFSKKKSMKDENTKSQSSLDDFYREEKVNLALLEKNKFVYLEKMASYLTKSDYWELDYLHIKLKLLFVNENDVFDSGRSFSIYRQDDNPDKILWQLNKKLVRVKSKQYFNFSVGEMLYPGKKLLKLSLYMLYPNMYQSKYKQQLQMERGINHSTDYDAVNHISIKATKAQVVPLDQ